METSVGDTGEHLNSWNPFHTTNWPRSIAYPEQYENADRLALSWDLGAISEGDKKKVIKQWCAKLPELQQLRWLNLWSQVTPPVFEAACQIHGLECLMIKWSNLKRLDAISDFLPLTKMTWLESFAIAGSMWSRQKVDSTCYAGPSAPAPCISSS